MRSLAIFTCAAFVAAAPLDGDDLALLQRQRSGEVTALDDDQQGLWNASIKAAPLYIAIDGGIGNRLLWLGKAWGMAKYFERNLVLIDEEDLFFMRRPFSDFFSGVNLTSRAALGLRSFDESAALRPGSDIQTGVGGRVFLTIRSGNLQDSCAEGHSFNDMMTAPRDTGVVLDYVCLSRLMSFGYLLQHPVIESAEFLSKIKLTPLLHDAVRPFLERIGAPGTTCHPMHIRQGLPIDAYNRWFFGPWDTPPSDQLPKELPCCTDLEELKSRSKGWLCPRNNSLVAYAAYAKEVLNNSTKKLVFAAADRPACLQDLTESGLLSGVDILHRPAVKGGPDSKDAMIAAAADMMLLGFCGSLGKKTDLPFGSWNFVVDMINYGVEHWDRIMGIETSPYREPSYQDPTNEYLKYSAPARGLINED